MLNVGDIVTSKKDYPEKGVTSGDFGTIVFCFDNPCEGYEVEFLDKEGYVKAVLTLEPGEFESEL